MTILLLVWLSMTGLPTTRPSPPLAPVVPDPRHQPAQAEQALRLDIRVFDGIREVTADTIVSVFEAGSRANARRLPLVPNGERQLALPPGPYDLQLLHQDDGRILRVRWTSLRLLVAYPGEHGQHLEALNLQPGFGALQVRRAATSADLGEVSWVATLRPAGGGEPIGAPIRGDGYVLFVTKPGRYDVEIRTRAGETHWIRDAEVSQDLTYLKSWTS